MGSAELGHLPMLYFCWTSLTTCVLADLRKIPSVARAVKGEQMEKKDQICGSLQEHWS